MIRPTRTQRQHPANQEPQINTTARQSILLVDDDPGTIRLLGRILDGVAELHFAASGAEALRLARQTAPDLILLDAEMPGMSGFQVCQDLKADAELASIPVIFVTSHHEPEFELSGFDLGAVDFIAKPISAARVLARVNAQLRLKQTADELRRISTVDALTNVANRRGFDATLAREWQRGRRGGDPLALLLLDVDHFKLFNDQYGHAAGDDCLRAIAKTLKAASQRPADLTSRYGGEEFALLLPGTPRRGAQFVAEGVLQAVQGLAIPHLKSLTAPHVTVSIGIASYDEESPGWQAAWPESNYHDAVPRCSAALLLAAADRALYAAKHGGRAQARLLDIADAAQAANFADAVVAVVAGTPVSPRHTAAAQYTRLGD